MRVSPAEASRRVAQLEGAIRKARKGREVLIYVRYPRGRQRLAEAGTIGSLEKGRAIQQA